MPKNPYGIKISNSQSSFGQGLFYSAKRTGFLINPGEIIRDFQSIDRSAYCDHSEETIDRKFV